MCPFDFRPGRLRGRQDALGSGLGIADRRRQLLAQLARQLFDRLAQRRGALGEPADGAVLNPGFLRQGLKVRPHPVERIEHCSGPQIAISGQLGEALIQGGDAHANVGDHPLRGAVLLGNPRG